MIRPLVLAALLAVSLSMSAPAARAQDPAALAAAMAGVAQGDWAAAAAEARRAGPLAFDIVEWHRLRAGEGTGPEYLDFAARRADWPGMDLLRRKAEAHLGGLAPAQVLAFFAADPPLTGAGALALVAAHDAAGDPQAAAREAAKAWREIEMTPAEEAAFRARHGARLSAHHGGRVAALLDRGAWQGAARILDLVTPGTRAVAQARIALQANRPGVDRLVAAVPAALAASAGLARDRADWRARRDHDAEAGDLILERSASQGALGTPALWADLRARMARRDLRLGNDARAWRLAAGHHLAPADRDFAELEWLAGYAALRIGKAEEALARFRHLETAADGAISRARAGYWQGRALAQMGRAGEAQAAFAAAGAYQTTFYGLLAAEAAGLPPDPALAGTAPRPDWRPRAEFLADPVYLAADLLRGAGQDALARRFVLHLAERQPPAQVEALADMALEWRDPTLALRLAKRLQSAGHVVIPALFPLTGIERDELSAPPELVLAITRRESEFDPEAGSPVGARGLMQLMPATAEMMARELGLPFARARLTDPDYNARLGAAYLATLRARFGASPVLVAAGYNAGPGRPARWITERGDPRNPGVDVVDWIEMIPYEETRTYVMRVAESLPVYRARLGLPPAGFTEMLRGSAP